MIYLFIVDNIAEFKYGKNHNKQVKIKETALEYFTNCDSIRKKINLAKKDNITNLDGIYDYLRMNQNNQAKILARNLTDTNGTYTDLPFTSDEPSQNETSPNNSSFKLNSNYLILLICLKLVLKNLLKTI